MTDHFLVFVNSVFWSLPLLPVATHWLLSVYYIKSKVKSKPIDLYTTSYMVLISKVPRYGIC